MSTPFFLVGRCPALLALCLFSLGSYQLRSAEALPSNQPVPREQQNWQDRSTLLNLRIKENPDARILFVGDSITQGWEGAGKEVWARYYGPRKTVNLGIGGDRTQHVLWRLENGNLEGVTPKVAVVMIGTNNSGNDRNTPGEIVDGVRAIVDKLRAEKPDTKILLLAIFPRGAQFNDQRGAIAQVNQVLQKMHDGAKIHYLDIGHRFLAEDGSLPKSLMPDFLHLSPEGYAIWADAIEPTLAMILDEKPIAAEAPSVDPTGAWMWTIEGPQGEQTSRMEMKASSGKLTGRFARDETRWLEIENGKIEGNKMTFLLKRDRPDGSAMVYKMTATVAADTLTGTAETEMDGAPMTMPWRARRD